MMNVYQPMEIVVLPDTTYVLINHVHDTHRRIFTDGRGWPEEFEPAYQAECRSANGSTRTVTAATTCSKSRPAASRARARLDASGMPLHDDNQSVVTERIYLDKANPDILHDEITVVDHALTRPWTVTKSYRRSPNPRVSWPEYVCADGQGHVEIADQNYFLSSDGLLMPAKKGQAAPDLRYFKQTQK